MADRDTEGRPDRSEENARLELPSLRLPGFGRRKPRPTDDEPAAAEPTVEPVAEDPVASASDDGPEPSEPAPEAPSEAARTASRTGPTERDRRRAAALSLRRRRGTTGSGEPAARTRTLERPTPARPDHDPTGHEPETAPDGSVIEPDEPEAVPREPFRLPTVPARVAVALTGLLVGVVGVALTAAGVQGCNAVRGTTTCGGGPGLLLLAAILVVMVLLAGLLLRLWQVAEARATGFLAVGILFVVALLGLQDVLLSRWMAVVVPLLCVPAFLVAHWVTTTFVEPRPENGPQHDVR